jgi:integrase
VPIDQAGIRRIRLHDVRHTYATLARDLGVNSKIVTDRRGQANETGQRRLRAADMKFFDPNQKA